VPAETKDEDFELAVQPALPSLEEGGYGLDLVREEGNEFSPRLQFPGPLAPRYPVCGYPRIAEFGRMLEELDLERGLCRWQGYYFYAHTAILENAKRSNHQMHTDKTNRDHSLDSESVAEAQSVSRLCDRTAADTLSGLDTDRWDLGFLPPIIREWQHETKLRAPRRHFSIQRRAAKETANWVWGTRSPGAKIPCHDLHS
jgi:hypothetical protein